MKDSQHPFNPRKRWTTEEISFLKEHYPTKGSNFCSKELNRSESSIKNKAFNMGLHLHESAYLINNRSDEYYKVNVKHFTDIILPEAAYTLGYLWADGYAVRNEIRLEIVKEDADAIKDVLEVLGEWYYYDRCRTNNKPVTRISTTNKVIFEYLMRFNFKTKSSVSPNKLLNTIPLALQNYFFRGIIDGDGCFYKNSIIIAGSYDQDWKYFEDLSKKLNIKCNTYRKENKLNQRYSIIEFNGVNAKKLGEYIYSGIQFGLERKKKKFLDIVDWYNSSSKRLVEKTKTEAFELFKSGATFTEIIKNTNIPKTTLCRYLKEWRS